MGLAAPALGSPASSTPPAQSTHLAGYESRWAYSSGNVKAKFVVPKLKCTGASQAITPSVGLETVNSFSLAGLFVGCSKGQAHYYPILIVNGVSKSFKKLEASPGDDVVLKVAESASSATVSVIDKTHRAVRKTLKSTAGGHGQAVTYPWVGDESAPPQSQSPAAVPDFGKLGFTDATLNGKPFGLAKSLAPVDRYNSGFKTMQIETGSLSSGNDSFETVFKHS